MHGDFALTPEEKPFFYNIDKLNSKIAGAYAHRQFILACMDKQVIPSGYQSKHTVVTASQTEELISKHSLKDAEHTCERMHLDVQHYNE